MDYNQMVDDALKGVVRRAMDTAAEDGLHGNHHFYVTFLTRYPGVELPEHLLERYPTDITIVLQHQYWDLDVTDEGFAVSLSFNKLPTRIVVPWPALVSFADPSVQFGLQFQPGSDDETLAAITDETDMAEPEETSAEPEAAEEEPEKAGEVVSLDAFRKK